VEIWSYEIKELERLYESLKGQLPDLEKGLELIEKALEHNPENLNYLDCKGWGFYKQGKYKEALEILQRSWNLRMEKAVYDHGAFIHLEAAKKAVAGQK
jgi:tetratricopeptide (TPR) repeat protein